MVTEQIKELGGVRRRKIITKFLSLGILSNGGSISRKVGTRKNKKGLGL